MHGITSIFEYKFYNKPKAYEDEECFNSSLNKKLIYNINFANATRKF